MPFTVTQEDILTIRAEAAVLPLEMTGAPAEGRAAQRLLAAGGSALQEALRRQKFLAVGSAVSMEAPGLPDGRLILTAVPRYLTGKANELLALDRSRSRSRKKRSGGWPPSGRNTGSERSKAAVF